MLVLGLVTQHIGAPDDCVKAQKHSLERFSRIYYKVVGFLILTW